MTERPAHTNIEQDNGWRSAGEGYAYRSFKTYDHSVGLSCAFRQWRATDSHCRFIHGYALKVDLEFESEELDHRNWVQDFGGLKEIKRWLEETFDHKTLVAKDDPKISIFREMEMAGLCDLRIMDRGVGCEMFARYIFDMVSNWEWECGSKKLVRVRVSEHTGNAAEYGVKYDHR